MFDYPDKPLDPHGEPPQDEQSDLTPAGHAVDNAAEGGEPRSAQPELPVAELDAPAPQLSHEPLDAASPEAADAADSPDAEDAAPQDDDADSAEDEGWQAPEDSSGGEQHDADESAGEPFADSTPQPPAEQRRSIEELLLPIDSARGHILNLSYPPTTLVLPPARAVGHRLASPVTAKSNLPLRPFATVDGLAVNSADLLLGRERRDRDERRRGRGRGRDGRDEGGLDTMAGQAEDMGPEGLSADALGRFEAEGQDPDTEHNGAHAEDGASENNGSELDEASGPQQPEGGRGPEMTRLILRPAPQTSRKDDSVAPGEAVPIAVGDEVPRGCDFVIPFAALEGEPSSLEPPRLDPEPPKWQAKDGSATVNKGRMRDDRERQAAMRRAADKSGAAGEGEPEVDDDDLPSREPARDWDLAQYYQEGGLELPRTERLGSGTLVSIGAWARNREALFHERTLLRPGEVALLEALGVPEVEVYRRPIVGIASLSEPLPSPNRGQTRREGPPKRGGRASEAMQMAGVPEAKAAPERPQRGRRPAPPMVEDPEEFEDLDLPSGICPLTQMCMHLCRVAQVAALPLGYAPKRFRPLSLRMERWLNQVDVLLLVGGSHHGPRCLSQDVIATYGRLAVAGADVHPGGNLSAGSLAGKPVFSMPGSLPEVLAGFVLFVRPLLHKYASPLHFEAELPVVLEQGSRIRVPFNTAVGLRYSYDPQKHCFGSRYSGPGRPSGGNRDSDTWMDFVRGQALAVIEGGREYQDGDVITAYPY